MLKIVIFCDSNINYVPIGCFNAVRLQEPIPKLETNIPGKGIAWP
jgi:hypothetical protein